jgi:hypothetical protein
MSEAKGSGVSLDANTTAQASQLELELFLRLAPGLLQCRYAGRDRAGKKAALLQILRTERSG